MNIIESVPSLQLLNAGESIQAELVKLRDAGCLTHNTERFEFVFRDRECVSDAGRRRTELANSYESWLEQIDQLRANHNTLNSFTIVELTKLIELSRMESTNEASRYEILALLRSVSKRTTLADVCRCCDIVSERLPSGVVLDHETVAATLEAIGMMLTELNSADSLTRQSTRDIWSHYLKANRVNVIVEPAAVDTIGCILSIYAPSLPNSEEVSTV